ncbi:NACHT domain-containing protein [Xanthobacteraceae bacterium Astr-EGSB]|uniref:NACHT domain-containing protein n=1 Tax=Astrobacterium formosum TaxID=3069710 RepID=UPI0027B5A379|nr:NACHT domain-containing protein [Xanthobacteraceae bacterium Astr-EGSB]
MKLVREVVTDAITKPLLKIAISRCIGSEAADIATSLYDFFKNRNTKDGDAKLIQLSVDALLDTIRDSLQPLFSIERITEEIHEPVAAHIRDNFDSDRILAIFLANDLDQDRCGVDIATMWPLPAHQFGTEHRHAYGQFIRIFCVLAKEIIDKSPSSSTLKATEVLSRLTHMREQIEFIVPTLLSLMTNMEQLTKFIGDEAQLRQNRKLIYTRDYIKAVQNDLNYLDTLGLQVARSLQRYRLDVGYVELSFKTPNKSTESAVSPDTLLSLTGPKKLLLVIGDAGSGKSTLMRWIATNAGGVDQAHDVPSWRRRIPFHIRIRDLSEGHFPETEEFVRLTAESIDSPPEKSFVDDILREGRGIVLFDGLDEATPNRRGPILSSILHLKRRYSDSMFVLTSRPSTIEIEKALVADQCSVATISELDRDRRAQFIDRWHEAVASEEDLSEKDALRLRALSSDLQLRISTDEVLNAVARNPLICSAICALHYQTDSFLPNELKDLYDSIITMLLHNRERQSLTRRLLEDLGLYYELDYKIKYEIMRDIAVNMVMQGLSLIPKSRAAELCASAIARIMNRSVDDPEELFEIILTRSGLLRPSAVEGVEFAHNTFKEYLAAAYYVDMHLDEMLLGMLDDSSRHNMFVFAFVHLPTYKKQKFIDVLLEKIDAGAINADALARRHLLLLACRISIHARSIDPMLRNKIAGVAKHLFPPQSIDVAQVVATFGDSGVRYLRHDVGWSLNEKIASIHALAFIDTELSRAALIEYNNDSNGDVQLCLVGTPSFPLERSFLFNAFFSNEGERWKVGDLQSVLLALYRRMSAAAAEIWCRGEPIFTNREEISAFQKMLSRMTGDTPIRDIVVLSFPEGLKVSAGLMRRFVNLRKLSFTTGVLGDAAQLGALKSLQSLAMTSMQLNDWSWISALGNLESVYLGRTNFARIALLNRRLKTIVINATGVSDIADIGEFADLVCLNLGGCHISAYEPLQRAYNLKDLSIGHFRENLEARKFDVSCIAGLADLERLSVRSHFIENAHRLHELKQLTRLDLMGSANIGASDIPRSVRELILTIGQSTLFKAQFPKELDAGHGLVKLTRGAHWSTTRGALGGEGIGQDT